MAVGAYPGTFDPPTVAHLSIAEAAWHQGRLDRVDLVVSRLPLGKDPAHPSFEDRVAVLEAVAASRDWLGVRVTDKQLIAEVAAGYDAVVLGADKWLQINDPAWYAGSITLRDKALSRLPRLLLVARPPHAVPVDLPPRTLLLEVDRRHGRVSSSAVRAGRQEWMAAEAVASGWWSDACRDRQDRAD